MACSCTPETCTCKMKSALQLIKKTHHLDDTFSLDFVSLDPITWKEGDHSKLFVTLPNGQSLAKKFSYATVPEEKVIRFTTRARAPISDYKQALANLQVGDFIEVSQPMGHFALIRDQRPVLLLSNGVGIATVRALVKAYLNDPTDIPHMTQINVDNSGQIYGEEFEAYGDSHFKSIYTSNRFDFYDQIKEATTNLLFTSGRMPYFYVVGSAEFVMGVQSYLVSEGFDREDILLDQQQSSQPTSIKLAAKPSLINNAKTLKLNGRKLGSAS